MGCFILMKRIINDMRAVARSSFTTRVLICDAAPLRSLLRRHRGAKKLHNTQAYFQIDSYTIAAPWPTPTHIVPNPYLTLRLCIS